MIIVANMKCERQPWARYLWTGIALFLCGSTFCHGQSTCKSDQFRCEADGHCIPSNQQCDRNGDCTDLSDERDCACRQDQFACRLTGQCVPSNRVCDGKFDCSDKTDERDCVCGPEKFRCEADGLCIPIRDACNRIQDCADNSDEQKCECKATQFTCESSGKCIASSKRCDKTVDCADGSDEKNCQKTNVTQLLCWQCMNYDAKGQYYDQCPMFGEVDPIRAYIGNCTGKCFKHNDDRNKDLIVRGCTGSQWGLPNPLPEDGCYKWYSEIWCVCSQNGCNGARMGNVTSDKEFDAHINYSKEDNDDNSGNHITVCHGLSFLTAVLVLLWIQISAC